MGRCPDFYFDMFGQVRMDRWSNGRVALLGDAGYSPSPLTGLGTSLAIVGAYVLAGELAAAAGDHRVAFGCYEGELRAYVEQCQTLPPGGIGGFLPRSRMAIWLRNQSMRLLTAWPWRVLLASTFHKAEAITLKDYGRTARGPRGLSPGDHAVGHAPRSQRDAAGRRRVPASRRRRARRRPGLPRPDRRTRRRPATSRAPGPGRP